MVEPILKGPGVIHSFVHIPTLNEMDSTVYYDAFRSGHKVARVAIQANVMIAVEDERVNTSDLEDDMMHLFGTDDFTYVNKHELAGVS